MKEFHTVDQIRLPVLNRLIEILDLSPDNDWENIARSFPKNFTIFEINAIKRDMTKSNFSPSQAVLDTLRNNLVPVVKLYSSLVDFQLVEACHILENEYPNDTIYKRPNQETQVSQSLTNRKFEEQQHDSFSTEINNTMNFNNQIQNFQNNQNSQIEAPISLINIFEFYESILPVIQGNKATLNDPIMRPYSSCLNFESSLPVNLRIYGKFEKCFINERKMYFRKKEFFEPYDYYRELKMIKHRHNNLYTAECIFKNSFSPSSYSLLYNYDNYPHYLLTEFASQNLLSQSTSQFNFDDQLAILRDVSCGLTYLHDKVEFKRNMMLHGNLQADSILVFKNNPLCRAKLVDFTSSVEVNDPMDFSSKILDEFNRFGLIIFLVITWRNMDKETCQQIHNDAKQHNDLNQYQYTIYRRFNMDKHPKPSVSQILLRMFYALTSADYDYRKGIKKSHDTLRNLCEQNTSNN